MEVGARVVVKVKQGLEVVVETNDGWRVRQQVLHEVAVVQSPGSVYHH